jgi:hypothetical protein
MAHGNGRNYRTARTPRTLSPRLVDCRCHCQSCGSLFLFVHARSLARSHDKWRIGNRHRRQIKMDGKDHRPVVLAGSIGRRCPKHDAGLASCLLGHSRGRTSDLPGLVRVLSRRLPPLAAAHALKCRIFVLPWRVGPWIADRRGNMITDGPHNGLTD